MVGNRIPFAEFPKMLADFRGRLHGEFQPGLKFRTAHQAEILLRLHGDYMEISARAETLFM